MQSSQIYNKNLRKEILKKVADFYSHTYKMKEKFVPKKTKIHYAGRVFDEKELVNLVDSSLEFWLTHGRYSYQFERDFAKFLGVKHCAFVNSGSSANLIAFMVLTSDELGERKIERGDEIITVSAGFPTTVAPIIQYGAVPVFLDITLDTYNIDVKQLKKALSRRTKAVMLAHTLGNPFDIDAVKDFCNKYGLWLIEDNCDALGSKYRGRYTGTFGDIATSSFFPAHHITTGEGGAVYTSNDLLYKIIISLRDWGRDCCCLPGTDNTCSKRFSHQLGELPLGYDHKYIFSHLGYNLKATDMQAAIGCAQLEKLPFFIKKRRENFDVLYEGLKGAKKYLLFPRATAKSNPCWFGFILTVRENSNLSRDDIVRNLEENNIQARFLFSGNLIKHPCFNAMRKSRRGYRVVGELKNTDYVMRNTFWVGVYPGMSKIMLNFIVKTIQDLFKK
ncbi:MAG: lipopolysaccharide biosynthesis protein RfbH [Candidatus Omnitrophota bacterium]|nr:lipopolysaccharide biosynthesis protein RfbH [Candidatus Omnitrophota bacterium]